VDLRDEIGTGLDEDLVAALEFGPSEVVGTEPEDLQVGAHGAVENDDALAQCLQIRRGGRVEATEELRRGGHGPHRIPVTTRPSGTDRYHRAW
jgi:hypothetical protein